MKAGKLRKAGVLMMAVLLGVSVQANVFAKEADSNDGNVSENAILETEEAEELELNEEAELILSGYCGDETENDGKNVSYTISDSNQDGIYDLLVITGNGAMSNSNAGSWSWQVNDDRMKITKVVIESGVTTIGSYAFYGCSNGCSSLREITIPDSVTTIKNGAFDSCSSLTTVTIPNGVTTIGSRAFYGCSSLREIVIPDSVTAIERYAFKGCSSLTTATVSDNVTTIGCEAFCGCSSLREITIPDSVTTIYPGAFYDCSSLREITIPNSVTEICGAAFYGCSSLREITIPDSVTAIGPVAFDGCSSLRKITIPDSVTTIGYDVFARCGFLDSIFIPDNGVTIESYAISYFAYQIKYKLNEQNAVVITDISRGSWGNERPLVEIPDTLYNYPIVSVDESFRTLVSEEGHTHKYNEAGICQICNKRNGQEIPEGPDTWKSKEGVEGFVFRLYNVAMNRDAEEAGLNDWNTRLNTKEKTAAQVAQGFIFSEEFKNFDYSNVQYVKVLYRTMFGREADKDGLEGWVSALENGMSREYVFHGFAESQEFTNLCGNFGVERGSVELSQYRDKNAGATGFIARLYTKMLGRSFDDDGIEYWCEAYLKEGRSVEDIASDGFLHSEELKNQNLSDEEFVTRMYETFLNRKPDEAGFNDWVGRLERGEETRDSLVYGFTRSKEFGGLKDEYNLP